MKKIAILLFLGMAAMGMMGLTVKKLAMSEYLCVSLWSDGNAYAYIYNGTNVAYRPYTLSVGRTVTDIATLFNQITLLDDQGYLWTNNPGSQTGACTRITTDTFGNQFNYNAKTYGYFFSYITISQDSTKLTYGNGDTYNWYQQGGGGTKIYKPKPMNQPAGKKWVEVAMGNQVLARTSLGEVYVWPNGDSNYRKLTFTGTCVSIAASHNDFYMLAIHDYVGGNANLGHLYWFGSQQGYVGDNNSRTQPFALTSLFKQPNNAPLPYTVKQVAVDENAIHFIDSADDAWGTGDNPIGNVGNGVEQVNQWNYMNGPSNSIYNWSMIRGQAYTNGVCYKIFTGAKNLQWASTYTFYDALIDKNDSLWMWGRNKSFVLPLGVANNNEVIWPNAIDILQPTQMSGFQHPIGTYYNFSLSTLNAGSPQTVSTPGATLMATGIAAKFGTAGYGYTFSSYLWSQVSGPNTATINNATSAMTTISGLVAGTYTFRIIGTDNNTGTAASTVTITYNPVPPSCNCSSSLKYRAYKSA